MIIEASDLNALYFFFFLFSYQRFFAEKYPSSGIPVQNRMKTDELQLRFHF